MNTVKQSILLLLLTTPAAAQLGQGELVLTYPTSAGSSVEYYDSSGAVGGTVSGSESSWISSALMSDGRFVVHNNSGVVSMRFFTPSGAPITWFPTPVSFYSSDIDVFSDDMIALCSRGEGILLFDESGQSHGALNPAGMQAAMGCQTQPDGTIWVADLATWPGNTDGKLWHLDRQGNVLHSFDTSFDASDVAVAPDGTLWASGWDGTIAHYTVDGTLLTEFSAVIDSSSKTLWSLAVGDDGLVWASGHYDSMVRGYDSSGNVIIEFDTTIAGNSTYSFVSSGNSWSTSYCSGDGSGTICPCGNVGSAGEGCVNSSGSGGVLSNLGTTSASQDNLEFLVDQLLPGQAGLLFAGTTASNGGNGQVFGDGLRCAGGNIKRLGVRVPNASGSASWGPGILTAQGWGAGETRFFQVWYRDTTGSPCGGNFNLTNGLEVQILP